MLHFRNKRLTFRHKFLSMNPKDHVETAGCDRSCITYDIPSVHPPVSWTETEANCCLFVFTTREHPGCAQRSCIDAMKRGRLGMHGHIVFSILWRIQCVRLGARDVTSLEIECHSEKKRHNIPRVCWRELFCSFSSRFSFRFSKRYCARFVTRQFLQRKQ